MKKYITILFFLSLVFITNAQEFSRNDSLRGNLTSLRTCYDVTFYDLFVMVDEKERSLEKSYNIIHFSVVSDFNKIQIDLALNMEVMRIEFEGQELEFSREFDAVFVHFPRVLEKGNQGNIKVWYGGYPRKAINAPWDGGFSWERTRMEILGLESHAKA